MFEYYYYLMSGNAVYDFSLTAALSVFFQETNIPYGHHHQMVSMKAVISFYKCLLNVTFLLHVSVLWLHVLRLHRVWNNNNVKL